MFFFRQITLFIGFSICFCHANAQLVDEILGQKRTLVQVLLKPYGIVDYQKERVVHSIEKGIHQTVIYQNDSCKQFYWAVTTDKLANFRTQLVANGYAEISTYGYEKDSLQLNVKSLKSGKTTLFVASISKELTGNRDPSGKRRVEKKRMNREMDFEAMPLLQQAILAEENDSTLKKTKDPQRHWIGGKYGTTSVLGWEQ